MSLKDKWEKFLGLEASKCQPYLQEGQEERDREAQASPDLLSPWKVMEQLNLETISRHEGKEGDQDLSAWLYKGEVMFN